MKTEDVPALTPYQQGCEQECERWIRIARAARKSGDDRAKSYAKKVAYSWALKVTHGGAV